MDADQVNRRLLLIHMVTMLIALVSLVTWLTFIEYHILANGRAIAATQQTIASLQENGADRYAEVISRLESIEMAIKEYEN
jgi:hypothetical protein